MVFCRILWFLSKPFLSSGPRLLNYPPPRRPPPHHHHFHFRKEIVKKTPALQGLGGGGRLVPYSGCIPGGLEGWDILAAPEWSRSGSFGRRRGGQTRGAFLRSFLFLENTRARAHSQPFGLAIADQWWRSSIRVPPRPPPPGAEAWRLGEDLPREAVPRKFSEAEATVQPGPPPRRIPGHSPFTFAGSASTCPGAAHGPGSRLSPRSSTVGATLSSPGPESGGGDTGGSLRREERGPPSVVARRRHILHRGWHHLPAGARGCAGAFLGGCAPGKVWGLGN